MKHDYQTKTASVDSSTVGSTDTFGVINAHEPGGSGLVERVNVLSSNGPSESATFNVFVDGSALFSVDQTHTASAATWQTFIPDQNRHFTGEHVTAIFSIMGTAPSNAAGSMAAELMVDDLR